MVSEFSLSLDLEGFRYFKILSPKWLKATQYFKWYNILFNHVFKKIVSSGKISTSLHLGEGNGNPLQYSFLENPMGGGAWWAAVHGVTQSRTRLKRLSSIPNCESLTSLLASFSLSVKWGTTTQRAHLTEQGGGEGVCEAGLECIWGRGEGPRNLFLICY